jgi:hypothetical protein
LNSTASGSPTGASKANQSTSPPARSPEARPFVDIGVAFVFESFGSDSETNTCTASGLEMISVPSELCALTDWPNALVMSEPCIGFQTLVMRIDRFHAFWRGSPKSARRWLQRCRHHYNHDRPNQALDGRTSAEEVLDWTVPSNESSQNHVFI